MRRMFKMALAAALVFLALPGSAQTVYETRGANGPVFSDKPQAGAKAVELKPLNVIDAPAPGASPVVAPRKAESGKEAAVGYRSFAIVFPENEGSVVANTAVFDVRVAVEPALQLGEGHAFAVSINGKPVGKRFTATEFTIPAEFWGDQLPEPNQRHQVDANIVDRAGAVLKNAAPVQFYLRHAKIRPKSR